VIPGYSLLLVCVLHYQVHTRPRVQRASGIPHALFRAEGFLQDSVQRAASREVVSEIGSAVIAVQKWHTSSCRISLRPANCFSEN